MKVNAVRRTTWKVNESAAGTQAAADMLNIENKMASMTIATPQFVKSGKRPQAQSKIAEVR